MKKNVKKFIGISVSLSIVVSAAIWYLFPVLQYHWHIKRTHGDYLQELSVVPICVSAVDIPSEGWYELNIDGFFFKVPNLDYKKIYRGGDCVFFISDKGVFLVSYNALEKEIIDTTEGGLPSFRETVDILKSVPGDISVFNVRSKNRQVYGNQLLKFISLPLGRLLDLYIIDSKSLKATCTISKNTKWRYFASAHIYSDDGAKLLFTVTLIRYDKLRNLKEDLLKTLSSIKVPGSPPDIEVVRKDMGAISQKYRTVWKKVDLGTDRERLTAERGENLKR